MPSTCIFRRDSEIGGRLARQSISARTLLVILLPVVLAASAKPVRAADTTETWARGATDFELFAGMDGIFLGEADRGFHSSVLLGYGILERFSAYFSAGIAGDWNFSNGQPTLSMGILATPLETEHFDADLFLDFSASGQGLADFQVAPAIELNYDSRNDLSGWGLYLRLGMPVAGAVIPTVGSEEVRHGSRLQALVNPGAYHTVAPGWQVLIEYDFLVHKEEQGHYVHQGGVAVGCNVMLNPALELVTQLYFDVPNEGENFGVNLLVGFIATVPAGSK